MEKLYELGGRRQLEGGVDADTGHGLLLAAFQVLIFLTNVLLLLFEALVDLPAPLLSLLEESCPVSCSRLSAGGKGRLYLLAVLLLKNPAKHGLRHLEVGDDAGGDTGREVLLQLWNSDVAELGHFFQTGENLLYLTVSSLLLKVPKSAEVNIRVSKYFILLDKLPVLRLNERFVVEKTGVDLENLFKA